MGNYRCRAAVVCVLLVTTCSSAVAAISNPRFARRDFNRSSPAGGSQPGVIFQDAVPASRGAMATMPVFFEQPDVSPENAISSFSSCVDYDPVDLTFDPTDSLGSGIPDATRFLIPGDGATAAVVFDLRREDCELLISIESDEPIPEIKVAEIDFLVADTPSSASLGVGCGDATGLTFGTLDDSPVSGFCSPGSFEIQRDGACQTSLTIAGGTGAPGTAGNTVPVLVAANADLRSIELAVAQSSTQIDLSGCQSLLEGFDCVVGAGGVVFEATGDAVIEAGPPMALFNLLYDVAEDASPGETTLTVGEALVIGADTEPCEVTTTGGSFVVFECDDVADCDDGVGCTVDSCEEDHSCAHETDDSLCDNGSVCDGLETCLSESGCAPGSPVNCDDRDLCTDDACVEPSGRCENTFDRGNDPTCQPAGSPNPVIVFQDAVPATSGAIATMSVFFEERDVSPENAVSSFSSCVDYDPLDLTFDPTDSLGFGIPDATRFLIPGDGANAAVIFDLDREDCELSISIENDEPIPEIKVAEIDFLVADNPSSASLSVGCGDATGLTFGTLDGSPVSGFCSPGSFEIQRDGACQTSLTIAGGTGAPGTTGNAVPVLVAANADLRSIELAITQSSTQIELSGCQSLLGGFECVVGAGGVVFAATDGEVIEAGPAMELFHLLYDVAEEASPGETTLTVGEALVIGTDAEPCEVTTTGGSFVVFECDDVADCDDDVACTVDSCDPSAGGCAHVPDHSFCDNGSFCDGLEECLTEVGCAPGAPVDCDDRDSCTDDVCAESSGSCENTFDPENDPTCLSDESSNPVISISTMQFGFGLTLRPGDPLAILDGGSGVELPFGSFLPWTADIDALDVVGPGRLQFSVRETMGVTHAGGFLVLRPERVYELDHATGQISTVLNLADWGISLLSLDAIDRLEDGSLVFASRVTQGVHHAGGYTVLRPTNAYRFDPGTGKIELILNGTTRGFGTIDALEVEADGRIALSFEQNLLVHASNGPVSTRQANAYRFDPADGSLTLAFDGQALGFATLDALSLPHSPSSAQAESIGEGITRPDGPGDDLATRQRRQETKSTTVH